MRLVLRILGGALLGAVVAVAVAVAAAMLLDVSQAEGAYAMAVAFIYAPLGAIFGAILLPLLTRRG